MDPNATLPSVDQRDIEALAADLKQLKVSLEKTAQTSRGELEALRNTLDTNREELERLKTIIERSGEQAHTRLVQGLQSLDERMAQRQSEIPGALDPILSRQTEMLDIIRAELKAHHQRIDVFESRVYDTLASFISVLQQLRSEVAGLADSIGSRESRLRLEAGARAED